MEQIAVGLKEAAASVGLSHWQLRKYIREGKLRAVRLGRRVLVEPQELERLIEAGREVVEQ
ncbi:MAG TPA: helix-turn-helix domain-containing protein [Bryobacteraceae bacterium]|nr:helix-turn-helix domain-containing protein [Bryobacteraceae bacterium]HXR15925.1 helix-turn-helix domain-containing protein [Terriglobales bacterium]HZW96131.1 helix-turn-helix domain-containing protein [Candidatus Eremiobacteraceae bacterium]